jgi:multiple antibiotic resistance protein
MNPSTVHFITIFMAFFAIMNPIANASLFVGLTDGIDDKKRKKIALNSVIVAFIIVAIFSISGREIFSIFGITLPAFRITGGVMIALIGYHMLQGESSSLHTPSGDDNEKSSDSIVDIAITPLGIPVLAGPGTIATAMNFSAESTLMEIVRVLSAFGVMCAITFIAFICGQWLTRALGQNAIKVISRLMGLILAVVGVQMLIEGIRGAVG